MSAWRSSHILVCDISVKVLSVLDIQNCAEGIMEEGLHADFQ